MKKLNKKGFTLIELIVVIAILAILAAILIPAVTGYITKAEDAKNEANCRSLYAQVSMEVMIGTDPTVNLPGTKTGSAPDFTVATAATQAKAKGLKIDYTYNTSDAYVKTFVCVATTGSNATYTLK